jgi:hypothetical protein
LRGWRADSLAIAVLLLFAGVTIAYLWYYDMWLARIDLMQQLVPYYGYLGEQLRAFNIPGWNPHQLSGMPFAADPLSGWTQWPVMALFVVLPPATAMKALVGFNLILATIAAYILARVLGMNIPASVAGGVAFGLGSAFIQFNSYCCNIMGNFAPWVPVALLGVELSMRRTRPIERVAAVALTGVALSQMLASFVGQGTYYSILLVASYGFYRIVISPYGDGWNLRRRILNLAGIGFGIAAGGFGLAAASLLPRLDISGSTTLKGGHYEIFEGTGDRGWRIWQLLFYTLNPEMQARRPYVGTAVLVLAILAPILARRQFGVPYFFGFSIVCGVLILFPTIVHEPFYLLPRFKAMHSHTTYRILAVGLIGPAMLAAATIDRLSRARVRAWWIAALSAPTIFYWVVRDYLADVRRWLPQHVWIVLGLTLVLITALIVLRLLTLSRSNANHRIILISRGAALAVPWLLTLVIFSDATGKYMVEAVRGHSTSPAFQNSLDKRASADHLIDVYTRCSDPGGAGGFLREQLNLAPGAPFRYFGFDPLGLRVAGAEDGTSYHGQQGSAQIQALLVATRATCLNLYDLQGYNPTQLQRYADFLQAANGVELNYHDAAVLASAITSPLIQLLNPEYVIVPYAIPEDRLDLQYVASTMDQVFQNGTIRVYRNPEALPHAWIVHSAIQLPTDQVLAQLSQTTFDPRQTVVVERTPPAMEPASGVAESVTFTSYNPDDMAMTVTSGSAGMLVLSEVYAKGWNAYVDGKRVDIYAADYALRGVPIPAGTHTVELRYELRSLTIGVIVSAVTLLAMLVILGILIVEWQRRRTGAVAAA